MLSFHNTALLMQLLLSTLCLQLHVFQHSALLRSIPHAVLFYFLFSLFIHKPGHNIVKTALYILNYTLTFGVEYIFHFSGGQFCKGVKTGKDNSDVKPLHSNASQNHVFKLQHQHVLLLPFLSDLLYLLSSVLQTVETGKPPLHP